MKQLALDIGLHTAPSLESFFSGPNSAPLEHLKLWTSSQMPSPVPTYLWGESGSGKSHLLQAVHSALLEKGVSVGCLDAQQQDRLVFEESWGAVMMDDVHLYNLEQQQVAFNWFVNALTHPFGRQPKTLKQLAHTKNKSHHDNSLHGGKLQNASQKRQHQA